MELAGDVEAVGKDVRRFRAGDRVFASTLAHTFGAYAEYKSLPEDGAWAAMPPNASYEEAAGLAIGASTALWFLEGADIRPGQRVLIYGASGGVGTLAGCADREALRGTRDRGVQHGERGAGEVAGGGRGDRLHARGSRHEHGHARREL